MSDTTNPVAPAPAPAPTPTPAPAPAGIVITLTPDQLRTALQPLAADLGAAVPVIKNVIADVKAGGIAGALKDVPDVEKVGLALFNDGKAALPTIKAGVKSTEFWIVAGVLIVMTTFAAVGHPLPVDVDAVLGVVAGIYTAARSLVKKSA